MNENISNIEIRKATVFYFDVLLISRHEMRIGSSIVQSLN